MFPGKEMLGGIGAYGTIILKLILNKQGECM
jgi:hypothetical protein